MREGVLDSLQWVVGGAMFVFIAMIAAVCLFLILRSEAVRPLSSRRWRREKSAAEEEADRTRRQKIRSWFWGGR
jgi:hypothetical protein